MKKSLNVVSVLGIALVATACNTDTTTAPLDVQPDFRSSRAPVHSVTAGGNLNYEEVFPGYGIERYGFNAQVDGNGNVRGQFSSSWPGQKPLHMAVTCLAVDGNQAWISATVTHSPDDALPEGLNFMFPVRDNGEGNGVSDEIGRFFTDGALTNRGLSTDCNDMPDLFARGSFPLTNGSLVVR